MIDNPNRFWILFSSKIFQDQILRAQSYYILKKILWDETTLSIEVYYIYTKTDII